MVRSEIDYGQRLQKIKDIYGNISDKDLAKKLNVSISTVYRVRTGRTKTVNKNLRKKINSRTYYYKTNVMVRYDVLIDIKFARRRNIERRWFATDYTRLQDLERAFDNLLIKLSQSGTRLRVIKRNLRKRMLKK